MRLGPKRQGAPQCAHSHVELRRMKLRYTKLLRGLDGFSDDMWVWLEHDADWIYPDGPTGHLHDVYYNQ